MVAEDRNEGITYRHVIHTNRFLEISGAYLENRKQSGAAPKTIESYRRTLAGFAAFYEERCGLQYPLESIPERMLILFASHNATSPNTVRNKMLQITACLKWAYGNRMLSDYPVCCNARPPKRKRTARQILSTAELRRFYSSLYAADVRPTLIILKDRVIFQLLLLGLRRAEICGLKWENVDLDQRQFTVRVKGGPRRIYPADSRLMSDFKNLLSARRASRVQKTRVYVLHDGTAKNADRSNLLYSAFKRLFTRAGVERTDYSGPHLFRHSMATHLYNASGRDVERVRLFLGHSHTETTLGYIHTAASELSEDSSILKKSLGFEEKGDENEL